VSFAQLNRRVHLYLGLALLPWFLMYGVSSICFAHNQFFQQLDEARGLPQWTLRFERPIELPVPDSQDGLRAFGAALLDRTGIQAASFGAYRQGTDQIHVYAYSFWHSTQLKYFVESRTVRVEDRRFRWDHFLTGMHARGGFAQEGLWQDSWSVVVDLVSLGMVVWAASGLYMWWGIRGHRRWGSLAILGGVLSFAIFTLGL
jgi:hypothetical protein